MCFKKNQKGKQSQKIPTDQNGFFIQNTQKYRIVLHKKLVINQRQTPELTFQDYIKNTDHLKFHSSAVLSLQDSTGVFQK